jgi:hypothetical protein
MGNEVKEDSFYTFKEISSRALEEMINLLEGEIMSTQIRVLDIKSELCKRMDNGEKL